MAAHAAAIEGHDIVIVSKARKSYMRGAQYLHEPIPLATRSPGFQVRYNLKGSTDQYRAKVYGPGYKGTISPEELADDHPAYDIREAYDALWDAYGSYTNEDDLSKVGQIDKAIEWCKPDLTISTIPADLLCYADHNFQAEYIWSHGGDTWRGIASENNTVTCNGLPSSSWYRAAQIQGHITVEWPHRVRPPLEGVHLVTKPLKTNCVCRPEIVRMGRYGKWQKGVLSHTAFYETANLLIQPEQMRLEFDK